MLCPQAVATQIEANSPDAASLGDGAANPAAGDGVMEAGEVADTVIEARAQERFWVLPHPEVADYVVRKAGDVDRWLEGMRRWQDRLFAGAGAHPGNWLVR